jgi:hypothetical protein
MPEPSRNSLIRFRLIEGAREAGLLLMVFAPLDIAVSIGQGACAGRSCVSKYLPATSMWFAGIVLFLGSVLLERRYHGVN